MKSTVDALRGILAGIALLGFFGLFLLMRVRSVSPQILVGLGFGSFIALIVAGGFSTVQEMLLGKDTANEAADSDQVAWWAARVMSPLEESWNKWSDAVVILGLGIIGVGSFVLLIVGQSENSQLGLLFLGFISSTGALFFLALLVE